MSTGGPPQNSKGKRDLRLDLADLLPTPTTQPATGNGHARHLGGEIKMLPTPAARLGDGRGGPSAETGQTRLDSGRRNLDDAVAAALLPTPNAADGEKGGPSQRGSSGDYMLPSAVVHLLPTPVVSDTQAEGPADLRRNSVQLRAVERLLPTPAVNDMGAGKSVDAWDEWTGRMKAAHGNGNGHGKSLHIEAARTGDDAWGAYGQAVARWENATGRQAPAATEPGAKGQPRLSPAFVEWMMGLPDGWVIAVPGVGRNAQLKALGNGVVPQQAAEALRRLLGGAR